MFDHVRDATRSRYEVIKELGRGGMAAVYLAHDPRLNRRVALKVMLPSLAMQAEMIERFELEARNAAALEHENIVTIYGVEEADDLTYFAMKFVDGASLGDLLRAQGRLPVDSVRETIAQVATALHVAHSHGVIHRDVKPGNVMIDRRAQAIVTDFGISKGGARGGQNLTQVGAVVGTPAYMSPEQWMGQSASAATDQYALGVMMYELLVGELPFRGTTIEMSRQHLQSAPRRVNELVREVSPELAETLARMLAKAPANRFASLEEVQHAVEFATHAERRGAREELRRLVESVRTPLPDDSAHESALHSAPPPPSEQKSPASESRAPAAAQEQATQLPVRPSTEGRVEKTQPPAPPVTPKAAETEAPRAEGSKPLSSIPPHHSGEPPPMSHPTPAKSGSIRISLKDVEVPPPPPPVVAEPSTASNSAVPSQQVGLPRPNTAGQPATTSARSWALAGHSPVAGSRGRGVWIAVAAGVLAVVTAGAWFALRGDTDAPAVPPLVAIADSTGPNSATAGSDTSTTAPDTSTDSAATTGLGVEDSATQTRDTPKVAARVSISGLSRDTLLIGERVRLRGAVRDSAGERLPEALVTWFVDPATIAAISPRGELEAIGPGWATVVARSGAAQESKRIAIVSPAAVSLTLQLPARLGERDRMQLNATAVDQRGRPYPTTGIAWSTPDWRILRIEPGSAIATPRRRGSATVVATLDGVEARQVVEIVARTEAAPNPGASTPATTPPAASGPAYSEGDGREQLRDFLAALRRGDADRVRVLSGVASGSADPSLEQLLSLMRQRDARFQVLNVDTSRPTRVSATTANLDYRVRLGWRRLDGSTAEEWLDFRALFEVREGAWRLARTAPVTAGNLTR